MKKLLYLALTGIFFAACSKKSSDTLLPGGGIIIGGSVYPTVVIGSQTWTSVNYNGPGGVNFNNGSNNPAYGKLYTWDEAKAIVPPVGWRLPNKGDLNGLLITIGALNENGNYLAQGYISLQLMSTSGWKDTNGTNKLGFNAQPAGYCITAPHGGVQFLELGTAALFLSSDTFHSNTNDVVELLISSNSMLADLGFDSADRASIRFVKDN